VIAAVLVGLVLGGCGLLGVLCCFLVVFFVVWVCLGGLFGLLMRFFCVLGFVFCFGGCFMRLFPALRSSMERWASIASVSSPPFPRSPSTKPHFLLF